MGSILTTAATALKEILNFQTMEKKSVVANRLLWVKRVQRVLPAARNDPDGVKGSTNGANSK